VEAPLAAAEAAGPAGVLSGTGEPEVQATLQLKNVVPDEFSAAQETFINAVASVIP
jgi:hypothetical protein